MRYYPKVKYVGLQTRIEKLDLERGPCPASLAERVGRGVARRPGRSLAGLCPAPRPSLSGGFRVLIDGKPPETDGARTQTRKATAWPPSNASTNSFANGSR